MYEKEGRVRVWFTLPIELYYRLGGVTQGFKKIDELMEPLVTRILNEDDEHDEQF